MELNQNSYSPIEAGNSRKTRKKTNLEKGLVLALILGSVAILGFLINTVRIDIEKRSVCDTPSCVLVAAQVISQVDANVDPCDDFFLFTCGKVKNETSDEHYPRILIKKKIEKQLQNLLKEPIDENDHYIINYEKRCYQACVADINGTDSFETLKEIFHDLKGWPIAVGSSWNENDFDWVEWTSKFRRHGLNHLQFLMYFVNRDSVDPTKQIVKIYPSYFNGDYPKRHKIMKNAALMFGAAENSIDSEIDDVLKFISDVANIRKDTINYTHEANISAPISEFQENNPGFEWLRYIKLITEPECTIKSSDYIDLRYADCVKALLEFIKKTSKRTIANYMFWRVIEDLLPIVTRQSFVTYTVRPTRTEMCRRIIVQSFSPLSSFIAYGKKYFTDKSRSRATEIFNRVKKEFKRLIDVNKWMTVEDKEKFRAKFKTMNEIIGMQNHTMDYTVYQHFFKDKMSVQDGFLKMYLNITTLMDFIRKGLIPKEDWIDNFTYFRYILDTETVYFGTPNTIMLPVGALQDWFYDEDKPMYVNFATIGKNIGVTFAKVITSVDVHTDQKIHWSEETVKGYEQATSCIQLKEYDNPMAQYYDCKILELGQIAGLKVAYNAYQEWVNDNGAELPARGTAYSAKQLFWISAVGNSCFEDLYGFYFYQGNEPLRQNPDFALDFSCSQNSKMNPSEKCNML